MKRIELHMKTPLIIIRDGLPKRRVAAIAAVAVMAGIAGRNLKRFNHRFRWRQIRAANIQADYIFSSRRHLLNTLTYHREAIRRQPIQAMGVSRQNRYSSLGSQFK